MDEQRGAEGAVAQDVEVLLHAHLVARILRSARAGGGREILSEHRREPRVAEVSEAMRGGAFGELVKPARVVHCGEFVVIDDDAILLQPALDFLEQEQGVGVLAVGEALLEFAEVFLRAGEARRGGGLAGDLAQEQLAEHAAGLPCGIGVVAHECDAARRERAGAECEEAGLHVVGHPGVDAVDDDVVERGGLRLVAAEVRADQLHMVERGCGARGFCGGDFGGGKIDAGKARPGETLGEREEVVRFSATQLEHAAAVGRRGREAENAGDGAGARGMGDGESALAVGRFHVAFTESVVHRVKRSPWSRRETKAMRTRSAIHHQKRWRPHGLDARPNSPSMNLS